MPVVRKHYTVQAVPTQEKLSALVDDPDAPDTLHSLWKDSVAFLEAKADCLRISLDQALKISNETTVENIAHES